MKTAPAHIPIPRLEDTARLGKIMAAALTGREESPEESLLILLEGGLGAGKTTLARFLVEALPGGELAEAGSPSFTLCNVYPTRPETRHFDLYRLGENPEKILPSLSEILLETLEEAETMPLLVLVEWSELLPKTLLPPSYLLCRLTGMQNSRRASFESRGKPASDFLRRLLETRSA
ncbi:MAG: tRNA (adenosine(37)-N6)-threonylcarbamoyltransferase complex ATPase subunit type 1 TsaE [Deltaproteobacteria bacterium]|jgi:tRNA threonylcarbamoyladenosine biosynthesis protein TsaE|nr:tRNA (adenosine(37)-N6)-threonylcarbamoyltransferase complex ATPase subunit type 1 TsaE [Deltaproteobacteria bacterium]